MACPAGTRRWRRICRTRTGRIWNGARHGFLRWAATIGPATAALVEAILASRPHPEQGYRSCLGLLRLDKRYGAARVNAACARALAAGARSYRHVDSILRHGLDRQAAQLVLPASRSLGVHAHVRGPAYYQKGDPT